MLFRSVVVGEGTVVRDSIIMQGTTIGKGAQVYKAIIAENVEISDNVVLGVGDYAPSKYDPKVYAFDLVTIGENSYIPANVTIGKNVAISGKTEESDYPNGKLESGEYIIKAGETR